ncbi:hypothetical protein PMAYCL1PPCAC_27376, partial [Pristionchus mayeri]
RLQIGRVVVEREHEHLHGRVVGVRRLARSQLDGEDAHRPDINLEVIAGHFAGHLLHHLRSHPAGRAHARVTDLHSGEVSRRGNPCRQAEIGDLRSAVVSQKDVGSLN